jgi:hypothetical protein
MPSLCRPQRSLIDATLKVKGFHFVHRGELDARRKVQAVQEEVILREVPYFLSHDLTLLS